MSDTQDNEAYLAQLRNRTVEMPLSEALKAITAEYLRQETKMKKLQQSQSHIANRFPEGKGESAAAVPVDQAKIDEEERLKAMREMDKHFAKNRKDIAEMRKVADDFRAKAEKSGSGVMKKYFNMRANSFDERANTAEQLIDRLVDPTSETRQKATEQRKAVARLKAEAEEAKNKFERETDPKAKKELAREVMKKAMAAGRIEAELNRLETPGRQLGLDVAANSNAKNSAATREKQRQQAVITGDNIQRDLELETPKLRKLEALLADAFVLERNGVETLNVRMLSKRSFEQIAEAVSSAAADMPADALPSEKDVPLKDQLEILNRQYDFARKHARGVLADFLWQFEETVQNLSKTPEGRELLGEVMPPMKKDQIIADATKLYAKPETQAKRRTANPKLRP